ncbi:MAG: hypothetical protein IT239_06220 [Bacteroidia bacterium]|nr:hypothetical protein [Bacteroidia bacterium]
MANKSMSNLQQSAYQVSHRNKKIGLLLLIGPFIGLIIALSGFALLMFGIEYANLTAQALPIINIIRLLLGLLGTICTFGILLGIPLGIIFLSKKELVPGLQYDERSGKKGASIIPQEIQGWNWGAAGLTWIWGSYHGAWIAFITFIPLLNLVAWIILGIKGNEWAWKARAWNSVDEFIAAQKKWKYWGMAILFLKLLLVVLPFMAGE